MTAEATKTIELGDVDPLLVMGSGDTNLRAIQELAPVRAVLRDGKIVVIGEPPTVDRAATLFERLIQQARQGLITDAAEIRRWANVPDAGRAPGASDGIEAGSFIVKPKSTGQAGYLRAMTEHDVVFGIGPAGTGKTFLAVAMAVQALQSHQVERIILVRPAVEAGESLGFLPGDYREKVDPYLRPLYDALGALMTAERVRKLMEFGVIEIAPLAYMRGRTLNRAFVILDEGQNTTLKQMKMFLTRLGPESRAVITGDITQVDLNEPGKSGLVLIQDILQSVEHVAFIYLDENDVVRHRLVRDIIMAFEHHGTEPVAGAESAEPPRKGA